MNKNEFIHTLISQDQLGRYVFTKHDFSKLFFEDNEKTLSESLNRVVKADLLKRACKGIYVNHHAKSFDGFTIEHIAKALRRNEYNYISLESALSEYGAISQIPIDRLTVMTTGRSGLYNTPFGVIEFTHTKRSVVNIINHIMTIPDRPLRIATKQTAWRDLKRVGRNIDMVDERDILND